jgi:hypothetical protein
MISFATMQNSYGCQVNSLHAQLNYDYLAMCKGNSAAALLLWAVQFRSTDGGRGDRTWLETSEAEIHDLVGHEYGLKMLRSARRYLVRRGLLLEERAPSNKLKLRFGWEALRKALAEITSPLFAAVRQKCRTSTAEVPNPYKESKNGDKSGVLTPYPREGSFQSEYVSIPETVRVDISAEVREVIDSSKLRLQDEATSLTIGRISAELEREPDLPGALQWFARDILESIRRNRPGFAGLKTWGGVVTKIRQRIQELRDRPPTRAVMPAPGLETRESKLYLLETTELLLADYPLHPQVKQWRAERDKLWTELGLTDSGTRKPLGREANAPSAGEIPGLAARG